MNDLTKEAGRFTKGSAVVFAGEQLVHMALPAHLVPEQVEALIKERQDQYYEVLGICDKSADSGKFIEFLLQAI